MSWTHPERPLRTIQAPSGKAIELRIGEDAADVGRMAAPIIADALGPHATPWSTPPDQGPLPTLGFSASPVLTPAFDEFIGLYLEGYLAMDRARVFLSSEFVGLGPDDAGSQLYLLNWGLLFPTDQPSEAVFCPNPKAADPAAEAAAYEARIAELGGIDLMVLAVEPDGRVGFNEAGAPRDGACAVNPLSDALRTSLAADFGGSSASVPSEGLTMGLGTLCSNVRRLLLVGCGAEAAATLARALTKPADESMPLSFIQDFPGTCMLALDAEAARGLP